MSDWDVDSYRTEFESEEHWELRRNFMLAHKDKLPEDEVVCLAQVFTNIELLGCRYPEETMQRVAELAKGVVEEYREKRKSCLKRTFVAASAAAVSKVKGQRKTPEVKSSHKKISENSNDKVNNIKDMDFDHVNRCIWDDCRISNPTSSHTKKEKYKNKGNKTCGNNCMAEIDSKFSKSILSYTLDPVNAKKLNELKPRFVFFLYDEPPVSLLVRNARINNRRLRWDLDESRSRNICSIYCNDILLGTSGECCTTVAEEIAAIDAITNLLNLCYTVKVKSHVKCLNRITPSTLDSQDNEIKVKSAIAEQIMRLMGWEGGGLGAKQQGIIQPIIVQPHRGREGLGLNPLRKQDNTFENNVYSLLRKWKKSDCEEDLVFSSEFTDSQRDILITAAWNLRLKCRTYGKGPDRHLVVYKKLVPMLLIGKLLQNGGKTNRYELVIPTVTIS